MIVLVDAFNLIYKFPELEEHMARGELEAAMDGLLARLKAGKAAYSASKKSGDASLHNAPGTARASGKRNQKAKGRSRELILHVFFDGKRRRGDESKRLKFDGMDLYYSHDLSADHLIMEFIKRDATPGDLLVVSTDKKVREFARIHRCRRQTSEEFAEWLTAQIAANESGRSPNDGEDEASERDAPVSTDEVEYWEAMFRAKGD